MANEDGQVKRSYDSRLRRERAEATRLAIAAAAGRLFAERGYEATSIDEIAAAAAVGMSPDRRGGAGGSARERYGGAERQPNASAHGDAGRNGDAGTGGRCDGNDQRHADSDCDGGSDATGDGDNARPVARVARRSCRRAGIGVASTCPNN